MRESTYQSDLVREWGFSWTQAQAASSKAKLAGATFEPERAEFAPLGLLPGNLDVYELKIEIQHPTGSIWRSLLHHEKVEVLRRWWAVKKLHDYLSGAGADLVNRMGEAVYRYVLSILEGSE